MGTRTIIAWTKVDLDNDDKDNCSHTSKTYMFEVTAAAIILTASLFQDVGFFFNASTTSVILSTIRRRLCSLLRNFLFGFCNLSISPSMFSTRLSPSIVTV